MDERVKISDIAQQSGVSPATVSLVLNNRPGVSQETRARVMSIAETLGYPIKPASAANRASRLQSLGMLVKTDPDIPPQANPFYSQVLLGIEDACRSNNINLLFATLPVDSNNRPVQRPQLMYNDDIDGLLMVGTFVDATVTSIAGRRTPPIVLVDAYSDTESYDAVVSDNFGAAYQAVEYLLKKGHRCIGLAGGDNQCYPSIRDRRNGYLRALKANGIDDTFIANFSIYDRSAPYEETVRLLKEAPQLTALFCVNDQVAITAMRAAQDLGKRIPQDISIIGYDDTYLAINAVPHMTSMRVDTVAMGRAAVQLLGLRLENPGMARMTLTIHPTLVERDSVLALEK